MTKATTTPALRLLCHGLLDEKVGPADRLAARFHDIPHTSAFISRSPAA